MKLVRFDAEISRSLGGSEAEVSPLSAVLLRTESASSSQIEQITAGARALALATLGESTGPNAALVAANAQAMRRGIALSDGITAAGIIEVQEVLLHGGAPEHAGAFRGGPVWIGGRGSTPHTATFVAPRAERVPELIDDLVAFIHRTDIDPLVQTAVAHAQFETIHPFSDGNGRLLVRELEELLAEWTDRVTARSDAAVWKALPVVISQPAVTVQYLSDHVGVSGPAAQHAVDQMVDAEILVPVGNRKRNRVWTANAAVRLLDDFAERAGRRRHGG
ncbi:Fic family protein [Citricoccus zhacaiensis]